MKKTASRDNAKTVVGAIDPDVLAFTVGQDPVLDRRLAEWDCYGTAAHVTMLSRMAYEPRLFSKGERAAVLRELAKIRDRARAGTFAITEEDQDCHLAIERTLTEALGDLGKRVHTGRSRNDQSATAIRLFLRDQLLAAQDEALDLAEALVKFARRNRSLPMVGRTHLQPAMPSSVATWAEAYAEELWQDGVRFLAGACESADRCPLGSAASYGVPLPIDRELESELLGFAAPVGNVLAAGNSRGKVEAEACAALAQAMVTLSRLAQDLILFSMPEFGYFSLPKEFCTGSSIMPQKYNPDVCELVRSKAAQVCGLSATANAILVGMPGGYNRDLQDTKKVVMEALDATRASLRILARLVGGLRAHPDRLRAAFADPGVFATDRALELVAGGMPWRDAYHQVRDHLEDLRGMDPDEAVAKKTHLGAPGAVAESLDWDEAAIRAERTRVHGVRGRVARALRALLP
ncbi:MAG: argininosuccinate lyase [Kiritimatiellae bacterium]|nr:argininosuccinate lyase [Kiritimatiellia bacterium]